MEWYLLKTWAGREEELVQKIRRTVPQSMYKECFVIYQERIWRKQQRSIVHVEPLFPGCVFLIRESGSAGNKQNDSPEGKEAKGPEFGLDGLHPLPVMQEDAQFLEKLSGKEHMVRLSYVQKDGEGKIDRLSGPLNGCRGQIERFQLKKRYAMVRHKLWGEEQVLVLGILLKEDENLVYRAGNVKNAQIPVEERTLR